MVGTIAFTAYVVSTGFRDYQSRRRRRVVASLARRRTTVARTLAAAAVVVRNYFFKRCVIVMVVNFVFVYPHEPGFPIIFPIIISIFFYYVVRYKTIHYTIDIIQI